MIRNNFLNILKVLILKNLSEYGIYNLHKLKENDFLAVLIETLVLVVLWRCCYGIMLILQFLQPVSVKYRFLFRVFPRIRPYQDLRLKFPSSRYHFHSPLNCRFCCNGLSLASLLMIKGPTDYRFINFFLHKECYRSFLLVI